MARSGRYPAETIADEYNTNDLVLVQAVRSISLYVNSDKP